MPTDIPKDIVEEYSIITSCRDCIFAECNGNEQTDCSLGRIDLFEKNGAEIRGQDDSYRQYFLIMGRFCNACRNHDWGERHPPKDWVNIVQQEFALRCAMIVYVDESHTIEDVRRTLETILNQEEVSPRRVLILINDTDKLPSDYIKMIREWEPAITLPWEVKSLIPTTMESAMDIGVQSIQKATYFAFAKAGYQWPPDYLKTINHVINYKMVRLVCLLPDEDGNGLLMDLNLHNKIFYGNKNQPVIEKVMEAAQYEDNTYLIKKWDELCE